MASHASAKKRIRQTLKRTARNKHIRTTLRTYVKRVRQSIAAGTAPEAQTALRAAVSKLHSAASKGVLHRKTASRVVSRLSEQVSRLAA